MKRILTIFFLLLIVALVGGGIYFFSGSAEERDVYEYIPDDFIFLIESDKPVQDWKSLSGSKIWKFIKQNEYLADVTLSANQLDSTLNAGGGVADLIKLGNLMISGHMTSARKYDFLLVVDLKGVSKIGQFSGGLKKVIGNAGYSVTDETYEGTEILKLYDAESNETLYIALAGNVAVISYAQKLVKKSLSEYEKEDATVKSEEFKKVHDKIAGDGSYSLYLNYDLMDEFMRVFMYQVPEMAEGLDDMMTFGSFDIFMEDEYLKLDGYSKQNDSSVSFLNVLKEVGGGKVRVQEILPNQTAMFTSIGFDNFTKLYHEFDGFYSENSPEEYQEFHKSITKLERFLKINVERDFFAWMEDEIILAVVPTDTINGVPQYSHYALLHFDDYRLTRERLDYVTKKIKRRTPVKFKETTYKGFDIKYLEMKGFFKLFFKKLFAQIEKPHYIYLDDYVVFSNDVPSLEYLVDQYLDNKILKYNEGYEEFAGRFDNRSNVFIYIQSEPFYGYLNSMLDQESQRDLAKNKPYLMGFPQIGFQMRGKSGMYRTHLYGEFEQQ